VGKPQGKIQLGSRRCRWAGSINMNIQEVGWCDACMGLIWLMIGTTCELFRTRLQTFCLHKMQGISSLVKELLDS